MLGATHPNLIAREGESYRLSLERLAEDRGVKEHVIFLQPLRLARGTQGVHRRDGHLPHALSQRGADHFRHAGLCLRRGQRRWSPRPTGTRRNCWRTGAGSSCPSAIRRPSRRRVPVLLDDPAKLEQTRRERLSARPRDDLARRGAALLEIVSACASRLAGAAPRDRPSPEWTLASRPYELPPLRLDHIVRMSDGTGIFQHAIFNVPNFHEGYCTDDNARAFILCNLLDELEPAIRRRRNLDKLADELSRVPRGGLRCQDSGRFRNFMSHGRQWLEEAGSEDSHARALWAVGTGAGRSRNEGHGGFAVQLFERGLPAVEAFTSPRAWAFTLLGIHEYLRAIPGDRRSERSRAKPDRESLLTLWQTAPPRTGRGSSPAPPMTTRGSARR